MSTEGQNIGISGHNFKRGVLADKAVEIDEAWFGAPVPLLLQEDYTLIITFHGLIDTSSVLEYTRNGTDWYELNDGEVTNAGQDFHYTIVACQGDEINLRAKTAGTVKYLIVEANYDEALLNFPAAAVSGGSTPIPHNLLSATHPDTSPSTPQGGAVIRGTSTPDLWEKIVGTNGQFLQIDGSGAVIWGAAPTGGEVNTASNVGGFVEVFKQKTGVDLEFRTLQPGLDIDIVENTNDIEIAAGTELERVYRNRREISVIPSSGDVYALTGVGAGPIVTEGNAQAFLDSDGYYVRNEATAGMMTEPGGFFVADSVRRELNYDLTFKFRLVQLTNATLLYGLFELDPTVNALATQEHIGIFRDGSGGGGNFFLAHGDGVTANTIDLGVADTNIHTIRIVADEANTKFQYSWDGGALTDITTNIPAATTNMILFAEAVDEAAAGAVDVDAWYISGFADR